MKLKIQIIAYTDHCSLYSFSPLFHRPPPSHIDSSTLCISRPPPPIDSSTPLFLFWTAGSGGRLVGGVGDGQDGRSHCRIGWSSGSIISSPARRVGLPETGTRTHRLMVKKRVGLIVCSKKKVLEQSPGLPPNPT